MCVSTQVHCTQIFGTYIPRNETVRPHSPFLHSCIWERFIYSHVLFLCCVKRERELLAQPQEWTEGQGTASKQWLAAVTCPSLRFCSWAESSHKWLTYKFPIWKITDHKWKQLILVVNFLFGLRVNEIPDKTLILDSHRPFICSVIVSQWEDAGFEPVDLTQQCSYWRIEEWDCIDRTYTGAPATGSLLPLGIDKKKNYSTQRTFCSFLYNVMARTSFKKEFA